MPDQASGARASTVIIALAMPARPTHARAPERAAASTNSRCSRTPLRLRLRGASRPRSFIQPHIVSSPHPLSTRSQSIPALSARPLGTKHNRSLRAGRPFQTHGPLAHPASSTMLSAIGLRCEPPATSLRGRTHPTCLGTTGVHSAKRCNLAHPQKDIRTLPPNVSRLQLRAPHELPVCTTAAPLRFESITARGRVRHPYTLRLCGDRLLQAGVGRSASKALAACTPRQLAPS